MIEDPDKYIAEFATPQTEFITVHQEACTHLHRTVQVIKALGVKAGVALNPATPPETLRVCARRYRYGARNVCKSRVQAGRNSYRLL